MRMENNVEINPRKIISLCRISNNNERLASVCRPEWTAHFFSNIIHEMNSRFYPDSMLLICVACGNRQFFI